jgi:TolA-binding protein
MLQYILPDNRMDSERDCAQAQSAVPPVRRHALATTTVLLLVLCATCTGCRSWRAEDNEGIHAMSSLLSTDRIRGPMERILHNEEDSLTAGLKYSEEGRQEVDQARQQFDNGQFGKAIRSYRRIAKKYKDSSIGEEAQYQLAECYFATKQYPEAQDAYGQLFEDYPSTRYVEPVSRRLFMIARTWLEVADPSASQQIRTVSMEEPVEDTPAPQKSRDPTLNYRILPNWHDKTRPVFDTQGRALQALKAIWLNDPTGPLADDALMLTAAYHLRRGNNVEADHYFRILREEYSDSPHLQDAYVLGSHVKLMSYQGPYYDGTSLEDAEQLKEQTLQLFPDVEERQKLREELRRLYLLRAQRAWYRVQYWEKKDNPRAVGVACLQVISQYPDTRYAEECRKTLATIDRTALVGLPGIEQTLNSLSEMPERNPLESEPVNRVKSVSDSRKEPLGRVRL